MPELTSELDLIAIAGFGMQLCTSPDSAKWLNVMLVSKLLLSLPFSMAKVEQLFSRPRTGPAYFYLLKVTNSLILSSIANAQTRLK